MQRLVKSGEEGRTLVQEAVRWMFPMTVEWFGLPDNLKTHSSQLDYKMKGLTNDQLRQFWMDSVMPFCAELGLDVPVHRNGDDTASCTSARPSSPLLTSRCIQRRPWSKWKFSSFPTLTRPRFHGP